MSDRGPSAGRRARVGVAAVLVTAAALTGCAAKGSSRAAPDTSSGPATSPVGAPDAATAARAVGPCPDVPRAEPVEGGLPALTLPCLGDGPDVRLSDLRGTPTVLNVWAAWCINCSREMPLFAEAVETYGDRVRFLGIHYLATREQGLASQDDFGVPFPSVFDEDGDRVIAALRATGPPQTFFVDADGRLAGREIGEITSVRELNGLIERYLGEPA